MRLFEIAPSRVDSPEGVLMTVLSFLKGKGDQKSTGVRLPTSSILDLMQNAGHPISYEDLISLKDKSQTIQNLIKGLDEKEVIINTTQDDQLDSEETFVPGDETDVEQMAKRAANRRK